MDLPQLRAFLEVAREGNLTRAASALCLSVMIGADEFSVAEVDVRTLFKSPEPRKFHAVVAVS